MRMIAADSPATLHRRHRALLETLREFSRELDRPGADPESVRGMVAFLRQTLLPFARREEAALAEHPAAAEGAALDHAFLAAEIDGLAGEARALVQAAGEGLAAAERAVRRRIDRLEAVLELHLARGEEADLPGTGAPGFVPCAQGPGSHDPRPRAMEADELRGFLAARGWGVLSTCDGAGVPYAVPVSFGWDGRAFVVASGPGRKLRHLEAGGGVCLTVPEVVDGSTWRCVVARGPALPVTGLAEKARALGRIARQQGAAPSPADAVRAARSRMFRIEPTELTGRARGTLAEPG